MAAYTTIDNPELYFQVKLYTGNATDDTAITLDGDENMQPDLVWGKWRGGSGDHYLYDSVRGATKDLRSNETNLENTDANSLKSFDSDGFTLGTSDKLNGSTRTMVAWCWKAGTTSGIATNVSTSTTPSPYSFNQTSGFSILQTTRAGGAGTRLVAHGLGAVPHFFMFKKISGNASSWFTYHHKNTAAPETDYLLLDVTNATADSADVWNDTAPDSVNIAVGEDGGVNDANNFITYAWTEIQGFSKFGSYTGNGNADGAFVYTGFKPAVVIMKNSSDSATPWLIWDNKRPGYNVTNLRLRPDTSNAEDTSTADPIDLLSNGFKCRGTNDDSNKSGSTFIYMAWAEASFVNSKGVPCNAR